jgi:lipoprotein-anchoring transpeptidase ErfK/SrfK
MTPGSREGVSGVRRGVVKRALPLVVAVCLVVGCAASTGDDGPALAPVETPTTQPTTTTTAPPTTTTTAPPTTTTTAPPQPLALNPGDSSAEVLVLQARLVELGYWLGEPDGTYGALTEQAVLAFQKAEGLDRDGVAGTATLAAIAAASRPVAREPGVAGIEIDLARQLLFVVDGSGAVRWALNTSTGTTGWRTPAGTFAVEREIDGVRRAPLGDLYRPKYFHGGIAVHGSPSIPAYPASHGCARVSNAAMDMLWASGAAAIGTEVRVYS